MEEMKTMHKHLVVLILFAVSISSCSSPVRDIASTSTPTNDAAATALPASSTVTAAPQTSPIPELIGYEFPTSIDPPKRYVFYLHGKIIEDQGLRAVSPDYGEYEYEAILKELAGYGFVVVSEQRSKNADGVKYAKRVAGQVTELLDAGVPASNITVVGASKGAAITVFVSHLLKNTKMNFVLLGTCHPDTVEEWKRNQIFLYGNVLAIYDFADDEYSGSCEELFTLSEGIGRHDEIILHIGTGHGILYKPLDEWILPAVQWADQ